MNERIRKALEATNPWWRDPGARLARVMPFHRSPFSEVLAACFEETKDLRAVLLTGLRRVGKTELARQVAHAALGARVDSTQLCWVKVDDPRIDGVLSLADVLEAWHPYRRPGRTAFMVLDEVQRLGDRDGGGRLWASQLKGAVDLQEIRILATGSAALEIRNDAEEAAGRIRPVVLEPLSFREFRLLAEAPEGSQFADLERYLTNGGFPALVREDTVRALDRTRELASQCLSAIQGIRLDARLRQLFAILMDQSSEELNVQALSKNLGIQRPTLENWIAALEDSFLIHRLVGIETNEMRRQRHRKVHATDPGLVAAFASLSDPSADYKIRGRMLEAAVLRHLREVARNARGKLMFAQLRGSTTSKRGEVDFLLMTAQEAFFVEVTGSATGSQKIKRIFDHIATYRDHGKTRFQLGDRRTFALVVAGRPIEEPGVVTAASFLDRLLDAPIGDPCEPLRRMSREVVS